MGIEYRHFLVVNDETWLPKPNTIARVEAVLRKWSLVENLKQVFDLSNGQAKEVDRARAYDAPGHGLALHYDGIHGRPVVTIAGPSYYENIFDTDRYTMRTTLLVGSDYRVHWSAHGFYFELLSPAKQNGTELATFPYPEDLIGCYYWQSFPCDAKTSPPDVKIHVADHAEKNVAWSNYRGFWRAALVIDFGKDLPAFARGQHVLPNQEFVKAVSEAFGARIAEVGEFF